MPTSTESSNRRGPGEEGSALVEFAMVLPLLCLILLGAIDFGRVSYAAMALTNAARAGAQYGALSTGKSSDTSGMQTYALASLSLDLTGATASAAQRCECDGTLITCTATCAGKRRIYVTVTTRANFFTITQFPGFPHSLSLVRAAELRAQ
jgi:Flp pilus assembly protein TadG